MTDSNRTAFQAEVDELQSFLAQSKVPAVQHLLQAALNSAQAKLSAPDSQSDTAAAAAAAELGEASKAATEELPAAVVAPPPARLPAKVARVTTSADASRYEPINTFAWDQGDFNSEWVSVYITLPGVGQAKDRVSCTFGRRAFDLQVRDLEGKSYRLVKDNLDKDITPEDSKFIVKKDKVVIKLKKVKGQYGADHWTNLTSKKPVNQDAVGAANKDPSAGIMDLMKEMYDSGDDNIRKVIGESMLKQQRGEKIEPPAPPSASSFGDFSADKFGDFDADNF